ncbi:hypothetical protein [Halorubrum lipolyticum]|nr:hypothetical protein [Halorubrum lipolyticum]
MGAPTSLPCARRPCTRGASPTTPDANDADGTNDVDDADNPDDTNHND